MTINANSYGTTAQVAALTPRYADNGAFTATTRPSVSQVETWINQTSATVNVVLSDLQFTIPVTQDDCVDMLASLVVSACADRAEYANRSGRFFSDAFAEHGVSIEKTLRNEITDWLTSHADGLENMGAERESSAGTDGTFSYAPTRGDGYHDYAMNRYQTNES